MNGLYTEAVARFLDARSSDVQASLGVALVLPLLIGTLVASEFLRSGSGPHLAADVLRAFLQ